MLIEKISRKAAVYLPYKSIKMRNAQAVVSFTFDDFPQSAAKVGAKVLEDNGVAGTFYSCAGLWGEENEGILMSTDAEVKKLLDGGHEIGCHTFSHLDCQRSSRAGVDQNLADNKKALTDLTGLNPASFAFPFGKMDLSSCKAVSRYYATGRSVIPGLNKGRASLYGLRANSIYSNGFSIEHIKQLITDAVASNAWLIFYTHDVTNNPGDFGCTPEELDMVVKVVLEADIKVLPVKHALGFVAYGD